MGCCHAACDLPSLLQGANAQFDFFLGQGGGTINVTNVVRNRLSCTDMQNVAKVLERTKRSDRFLGPNNSPHQIFRIADLTWRGELHPQTLHLQHFSVELPRHYNGGYALVSVLHTAPARMPALLRPSQCAHACVKLVWQLTCGQVVLYKNKRKKGSEQHAGSCWGRHHVCDMCTHVSGCAQAR
jgi:hypothetical protein